ncbi:MAG TPA: hypothetical protein VFS31_12170, partial [Chitinophagaceae bacterium]|nr:hypothetical protein [Chitinophagaceae bacterium]
MAKKPCNVTINGQTFTREGFMAYLLQNGKMDPYVYGNSTQAAQPNQASSVAPSMVENVKKIDYTTQNGNQRVTYDNGALKVLNAKTGEEVSAPTKRKAIREAVDNYDFTQGEHAPAAPESAKTEEEIGMHIATTSNNPAELVGLWQAQEPVQQALSSKEAAILDFGGFTTTNKSYRQFGDRNNMSRGK